MWFLSTRFQSSEIHPQHAHNVIHLIDPPSSHTLVSWKLSSPSLRKLMEWEVGERSPVNFDVRNHDTFVAGRVLANFQFWLTEEELVSETLTQSRVIAESGQANII